MMLLDRKLAALFACTTLLFAATFAATGSGVLGQKAGELNLEPAEGGKAVNIAQFKGKPVLLVFWATWCPPCRNELPAIRKLHEMYTGRGLHVVSVGIAYRQTRQALADFKAKNSIPYPVLWDKEGAVSAAYQIRSVPTNILVGPDGVVRYRSNSIEPSLIDSIEKYLPESAESKAPPEAGPADPKPSLGAPVEIAPSGK